ncbi:hypothetical protein QF028_003394 [Neobacillus sp. B4I6]
MKVIYSKDKTHISLPTGQVSVAFGSKATKVTYPTIGDWLEQRSD